MGKIHSGKSFPVVLFFFVFFITAGISAQSLVAPDNTPLCLGNPSHAVSDPAQNRNYLMEKKQYTLSYNDSTGEPNWTAWHLCRTDRGNIRRSGKFRPDMSIPAGWYRVQKNDYQYPKYGFDRGHLCPSADRTATEEDNSETFLMTNMVPQAPDCNRIVWKALEDYERELVQEGNELYIFAGPCGTGGTSADGSFTEIPVPERNTSGRITTDADGNAVPSGRNIPVPAFIWKIILVLPEGDNDLSRITAQTCIIVVEIPNKQGCGSTGSWQQYETNVDSIESATGFDFFDLLDDTVEDKLESTVSHYE